MKRFFALLVSLFLLGTTLAPSLSVFAAVAPAAGVTFTDAFKTSIYTSGDLKGLPSETAFENDFLPATAKWLAQVGGEQPATFSKDKIKYTLSPGVTKIDHISEKLADAGQLLSGSTEQKLSPGRIVEKGGYISKAVLDNAAGKVLKNGSVVVDEAAGTAFKISSETQYTGIFDSDPELNKLVKPLEGTYSVTKPELHEIVGNFELKEDTVQLNKANITGFAPNVELAVKPLSTVDDSDKKFKYLTGDNLIELDFKDVPAVQGKVGNSTIYVGLSGGIAIGGIQLTGRYSCNGGYEISLTLQQECYLVATLDAEVHEEIRVPILGIDIPFGIGSVYGGVFAVIGMDGTIRLDIEARETSSCKMGIKGGTFLYVPTSFQPIFEPEPPKLSGDCGLNGQINGFIKFGPMLGIELFGFDLAGAGVLLGAGVNVDSDGSMMDVELYASIDIYVTLADENFNLLTARPTIYKKQQPDMHGYRVSFLETYISPGRVGGLIEEEPTQTGGAYLSSVGLDYRIWIIPKKLIGSFDAAKRETILSAAKADVKTPLTQRLRTYPDTGFSETNIEGEFFEENPDICYEGDQIWLEFIGQVKDKNGNTVPQTFFVGPAKPILPFIDITITQTDLFNDYITGKVEPVRTIIWDANRLNPDEEQTELTYYQGPIFVSPFNDYGMETSAKHRAYTVSGTARTDTDEKGVFDTRNPYRDKDGNTHAPGVIDVLEQTGEQFLYYENGEAKYAPVYPPAWIGVFAYLQINYAVRPVTFYGITPGMPEFQITRSLNAVKDSQKTLTEGGKVVNQMEYDEYIWIANLNGTRAVTADMLSYAVTGFSSQDYKGYGQNPVTTVRQGPLTLIPAAEGNPDGTALYAQRVTVQWVWQEHPNPIKITSKDHTQVSAGVESSFQVTADGFLPRFSLEGAPRRVWIDEKTGLLYIPQTLSPGEYVFTIHAKEGIALSVLNGKDPKKGNDSSPPDSQTFTLTVTENTVTSSSKPSESSVSSASVSSSVSGQQVPVIYADEYNTYLTMDGSKDLTVAFKATGSTPITWELALSGGKPAPTGVSIDTSTGLLKAVKSVAPGTYTFVIKAVNSAGSDQHECTLVVAPLTAPVLENRRDGYKFSMSRFTADYTVQLKATGSAPIVWSLEAVNARIPVPAEVTIGASTGILHVKGGTADGIKTGSYEFIVKASNAAGSDQRTCTLEVTTPLLSRKTGFSSSGYTDTASAVVPIAKINPGNQPVQTVVPDLFAGQTPPNNLTIRCDDPKDVYTHDRETCDGAYFIHWDTSITITLATMMNTSYLTGTNLSGQNRIYMSKTVIMSDNTPVCDRYHYYDPSAPTLPLSTEELEKLKANLQNVVSEEMAAYKNGYNTVRQIGANDIGLVNPIDRQTSVLDYGALVAEINGKKGGAYSVELTTETGTVVSGAYFTVLKGNSGASITFRQEGADITFAGKEIKTADEQELINIGFTHAVHEKTMLDQIGSDYKSFTYGFQHHGALPGTATFSVSTTLSAGETVNVYKFDASSGTFTLIAKGLTVGEKGIVTYQNNTMSEYVITTKTIPNAELMAASAFGASDSSLKAILWIACACLSVLIITIALWVFLRKRKKHAYDSV
ncbi:MAG TPA: Ig domain-containing protein [Oscillospiraceae bacterium]|nr:Ig domain-containing protein [Oscillospiraceae bacterium]HPS34885.1 Ig domain-containing protein [Oscillospiraceae bacterium]